MIKEILTKKHFNNRGLPITSFAFLCQGQGCFDRFIQITNEENIIYSKTLTNGAVYIENEHINETHRRFFIKPAYILIWIVNGEYQFYSRVLSEYENYNDWDKYIFFDFTQMNREKVLNSLNL